jgi:hypothetical protein
MAITPPAARLRCHVDRPCLRLRLERGAERASAPKERLDVAFQTADGRRCLADASFDAVVSTFGVMFAFLDHARHARGGRDSARVCRVWRPHRLGELDTGQPDGREAFGCWPLCAAAGHAATFRCGEL